MKKSTLISAIILYIIAGWGCKQSNASNDGIITVNVTENYPKKELILQDFMDVEYIALETKDDFINQGFVQDIGKDIILVKNRNDDGDIFVYNRAGKALTKINRKGQGGEEYIYITNITLDEDNREMFVNDHFLQKIVVYDLYGKFKRYFKYKENREDMFYTHIFNYDKDNLICYDQYNKERTFVLISKQNGIITKEIKLPFKKKKLLQKVLIDKENNTEFMVTPGPYHSIIPFKGNWVLLELSSDTVYTFLPDYSLRPFIVRIPSIQSMNPEDFLILRLLSDRYYFMETIKNVYDFDTNRGFPKTFFMYDKKDKVFFRYNVYNSDFSIKKGIYMNALRPVNHEIESWQPLEAPQLVEFYKKGELNGKLKEIAATLDEESNPVIMLIKHKK